MVRRSHAYLSSEIQDSPFNPGIVSRYNNVGQTLGFFGLLINPLDHGLTPDVSQRLARET